MTKTCGRVLLVGMSNNEQVQFFDLQICGKASNLWLTLLANTFMYLPVILTINFKFFRNHSGIYKFRKNSRRILLR